jgi:sugar phosphate isomerase/epimerase
MAIPVAFSTGSLYPFGLERVYDWAAEAGYDGVEVMMDERWDTHQDIYLRDLVEKHGVPILALHPPLRRGAWGLGPEETLVRVARLARRMEVPVVVAHPPPPGRPLER